MVLRINIRFKLVYLDKIDWISMNDRKTFVPFLIPFGESYKFFEGFYFFLEIFLNEKFRRIIFISFFSFSVFWNSYC